MIKLLLPIFLQEFDIHNGALDLLFVYSSIPRLVFDGGCYQRPRCKLLFVHYSRAVFHKTLKTSLYRPAGLHKDVFMFCETEPRATAETTILTSFCLMHSHVIIATGKL